MIIQKDSSRFFATEHLAQNLKKTTLRGGAITFGAQIVKLLLQTSSTIILARILTPQDFGQIAMVSAVTGFILIFKDLGLSMATIQKDKITHEQVTNLFWINIALSTTLMVITICISPLIAWFYHDQHLLPVTNAIAGGFILGGLTVQHQSLLRRQMRFKAIALIDISALAGGIAIAVLCALNGLGYWSLVLMQIVNALILMLGSWISCGWVPGFPKRNSVVKQMVVFGGNLTLFNLLNYFIRNFDNILIGRVWGSQQVGLYSKAYSLLLLPLGQITAPMTSVAVPALSRLQNNPKEYRSFYLKSVKIIAFLSMPLITFIGTMAQEIIMLLLGKQWEGAVPIFRFLAFAAFLQPVTSTMGWIYISFGRTDRMAAWALIALPFLLASFIIGIHWGAKGVALGYAIAETILAVGSVAFAVKNTPLRVKDIFQSILKPFYFSSIILLATLTVKLFIPLDGYIIKIAISGILAVIVGLSFGWLFKPIQCEIAEVISTIRTVFK